MEIKITCSGADLLPIDTLLEFQGELKKLKKENREKLQSSILKHGFMAPFFVWDDQGEFKLIDGHQRLSTLLHMRGKGYEIPLLPVDYIHAENEEDAKRKLLQVASQYGTFTIEGFEKFIDGITIEDEGFNLVNGPFNFTQQFDNPYTTKIELPIYEPKGEKPKIDDMIELSKYNLLIEHINKADISEEIKVFLRYAATRHIKFRYDSVAEFYCHQDAEVQKLMEDSALVIIDFEAAIVNGFVQMNDDIANAYLADYNE